MNVATEMDIAARAHELGLTDTCAPSENVVVHLGLAETGSVYPFRLGSASVTGRVGRAGGFTEQRIPLSVAANELRSAMMNALESIAGTVGGFDRMRRILRVTVHVVVDTEVDELGSILSPALELLDRLFGRDHRPVVSILGVSALPGGVPVAIELTAVVAADR